MTRGIFEDLTGKRFGSRVVMGRASYKHSRRYSGGAVWYWTCNCGNTGMGLGWVLKKATKGCNQCHPGIRRKTGEIRVCISPECNEQFYVRQSSIKRGNGVFHSIKCARKYTRDGKRRRPSLKTRVRMSAAQRKREPATSKTRAKISTSLRKYYARRKEALNGKRS